MEKRFKRKFNIVYIPEFRFIIKIEIKIIQVIRGPIKFDF
jgi:hypothetical protein